MHKVAAAGVATAVAVAWVGVAEAAVKAAAPFTDNLVLQQGRPVPVWGQAAPGERVTVQFEKQTRATTADAAGRWRVDLKPLKAQPGQAPQVLTVSGRDATGAVSAVTFSNVLVGEVWVCSGQSNMEWPLSGALNPKEELAAADFPAIRMFTVSKGTAAEPQSSCQGRWVVCSPASAGPFSAVGYFFARHLHRELGVPVGMLHTSWGGSPIEPWTDLETLRGTAAASNRVAAYETALADYRVSQEKFDASRAEGLRRQEEAMAAWRELIYTNELGRREGWHLGVAGSALWKDTTLPMPDAAAFLNNYIGFVWCRRTVEIPESWVGRDLILKLGSVDEEDVTYVNGVEVGRTVDKNKWQVPRQYPVPAAAVTGRTVRLALSVMNEIGGIGVFGAENDYSLAPATPAEGDKPVSVAGAWQYAFGGPVDQKGKPRIHVPGVPGASWDVSTLYNAMVAPLLPYAARGAIWYQGESNSGQPDEYAELLPALIRSWRKGWGEEFDFLFVQLANFMTRQRAPVESQSWADLRESQRRTLSVPRTGMAVIIDIGEANDIHPRNKQDVGKRLALWALARTYGRKGLVYSGPLYRDLKVEGARATVRFDHAGGGLVARGEPLTGFAVAGSDRVFHAAQARLEGSTVVVSSDQVPAPVAVRYGWASNPICNLYNKEGLPASPFRTDNWPGLSVRPADEMLSEPR